MALYGAETWKLRKVDEKCMESFEMCCWRRSVGPIVREMRKHYLRVKEERNILRTIKRGKGN
jgi:hypothetical protein